MPFLLRSVKRRRWLTKADSPDDPALSKLPDGERQGEVFLDLQAEGNELSVWLVSDTKDNLDEVITAIAAGTGRDFLSNIDYVLFDYEDVAAICTAVVPSPGATAYEPGIDLHRDISLLTASQLHSLATKLAVEVKRVQQKRVAALVKEAVGNNLIAVDRLTETMRGSLR